MPNPFPGMDPYLEGPLWGVVHSNLIQMIAMQLAPKLRPKYLALTNERVTVTVPDSIELGSSRHRLPDVGVFQRAAESHPRTGDAAVVLAPLEIEGMMPEPLTQTFVEIRHVETHRLVTSIELLSPTNKRGDGLGDYRAKRLEVLASDANLLEIDLLRIGERFPVRGLLPSVPYFVFLSRVRRRPRLEFWPISLDEPLPKVAVPLLAGDADVELDLQLALNTAYETYSYDLATDHSETPTVPLDATQVEWSEQRLHAAGMR